MDRGLLSLRRWSSLGAFLEDMEASLGDASEVPPVLWTLQKETLARSMKGAEEERAALTNACSGRLDERNSPRSVARASGP